MHEFFRLRIRLWGLLTAAGFLGIIGSIGGFLGQFAWWLDIGSHFRVQYVALFAVLATCYFVGKKRVWGSACLLLTIVNAMPVISFLLPTKPYDNSTASSLRVALINVNTRQGDSAAVSGYLSQENPDIVILEEINDEWIRRLSPALQGYPVRLVESREDNFGMALFARVEALSTQLVYFGSAEVPSIVATMRLAGRPFTLLATHPLPPGGRMYSQHRNEQLREVADFVRTNSLPLLLCGDLNVTPWSPHYRSFIQRSGLVNSSRGRAIHTTWPTFSPLFRIPIDHCLHSAGIAIRAKRIGEALGSDHFPVAVDFVVAP